MTASVTQIAPNDNQRNQEIAEMMGRENNQTSALATEIAMIVSAYIGNHSVPLEQLPEIISIVAKSMRQELYNSSEMKTDPTALQPAVPIHQSVVGEYLICLEDGKKMRMLKRYLRTQYGMTPEQYKIKWNLPASYPMTAPGYSKKRSEYAKKFGLGRQPGQKAA